VISVNGAALPELPLIENLLLLLYSEYLLPCKEITFLLAINQSRTIRFTGCVARVGEEKCMQNVSLES
jgi:hypothetical protein